MFLWSLHPGESDFGTPNVRDVWIPHLGHEACHTVAHQLARTPYRRSLTLGVLPARSLNTAGKNNRKILQNPRQAPGTRKDCNTYTILYYNIKPYNKQVQVTTVPPNSHALTLPPMFFLSNLGNTNGLRNVLWS